MTPQELYDQAKGDGVLILVLPRVSRGCRIRLTATGGPLGEILNVRGDKTTARFQNAGIRRYILKHFKNIIR